MRDKNVLEYLLNDVNVSHASFDLLLGELIGEGSHRDVYNCPINDKWVVKVEKSGLSNFHNAIEYELWSMVKDYEGEAKENITSWFAPCRWISGNGRILMQDKTSSNVPKGKEVPSKIPNFFTDIKSSNFGWLNGRYVAHDYDFTLYRLGYLGFKNKMQNVKIW